MIRLPTMVLFACALSVSFSASAADDEHETSTHHIERVRFDAHANVGVYASLGVGFRADLPILGSGLIAGADDEIALSAGLDVFFHEIYSGYYQGGPYVVPSCLLQWNFYLGPRWSVFPEAGFAFYVGGPNYLPRGRAVYAAWAVGMGARYHFGDRNALLVRVSTPTGLQVGVTF